MKKIFIALILGCFCLTVWSQEKPGRFTFDIKGGFSIPFQYNKGILLGADVSHYRQDRMLSIGYAYMEEFTIWTSSDYVLQQIDLLYGKQWNYKIVALQILGGVGPVWGNRQIDSEMENYFTAGLFLKAGYTLIPIKFAGLTTSVELNLNVKNPVLLLTAGLTFGKVRNYQADLRP